MTLLTLFTFLFATLIHIIPSMYISQPLPHFFLPISLLLRMPFFPVGNMAVLITVQPQSHPFCGVFWRASELVPVFSP